MPRVLQQMLPCIMFSDMLANDLDLRTGICVLYLIFIVVFIRTNRQDIMKGFTSYLRWYMKVSWLLNSVVTVNSVTQISVFYWIFIFRYQELTLLRLILHGMNSIYVLTNRLITAIPVSVYHVVYPLIYGVIYTSFSILYHILGRTNGKGQPHIYKILDWSKLKRTLPLVHLSTFVALLGLYLVVFFLHKLRIYARSKCLKRDTETRILDSLKCTCLAEHHSTLTKAMCRSY
ncbi:protein rolling stone-like [Haliotis asinina]|uniref:protein rolling stone-like n=1 Tax=Haliotis asinina TaxID=109174 RepID=UPI003531822A